ncbi:hypothetical protein LU11_gp037 [Pseudomonas phage Lu11]|uniref:hypothetical protein n=1 Tax=Pseudomonas phage Lu11 TaxID=1161927 RepID=UPI00025F14FF|nr:hypothetical protein LU11_gp037 [Pseudomonas phage Lu11]AFH14568.1 hypothetical protein Lu11_0037 [Pseudomonas phage Lu11]
MLAHDRGHHMCTVLLFETNFKQKKMTASFVLEFFSHASDLAPGLAVGATVKLEAAGEDRVLTLELVVAKRRRRKSGDGFKYELTVEGKM